MGVIEAINGEVQFRNAVVNADTTGLIAAREATLRFDSGLTNFGGMGFRFGASDVFGDISNEATATINLSGGANVTFYDVVEGENR